jgi:hypothetical protein
MQTNTTPKGHANKQKEKTPEPTPKGQPECDHSPKHEQTLANLKQQKTNNMFRHQTPPTTPNKQGSQQSPAPNTWH